MNEENRTYPDNITEFPTGGVIPAARPLTDFAHERAGDDLILFDGETMQYHTLNAVAEQIWRACDGAMTIETIAAYTGLPVEVVETTIAELGEASLLAVPASGWTVSMNRRRAARLIAAGAIGLPVVLSITAPNSASAYSLLCNYGTSCSSYAVGTPCTDAIYGDLACCVNLGNESEKKWWDPEYAGPGWSCG